MIKPPYLKAGDEVHFVSTARSIGKDIIEKAMAIPASWGLNVKLGEHLYSEENQFAGSDVQRASDFQKALDDPNCKAIFCARGGYGTVRILDQLDFNSFSRSPKWIIGYSDITVLHSHLQKKVGIESIHATMPVNFAGNSKEALDRLRDVLFGIKLAYSLPFSPLNKEGSGRGIVTGGNLSILYSLKGSESFPDMRGRILFIEDLDEYLYHIDRMMIALKRAAALESLAGLIVGGLTKMNDNEVPFGKSAEEIIMDEVKSYKFPVCFGFPAGHIDNNCPLIMGRTAELIVSAKGTSLKFNS